MKILYCRTTKILTGALAVLLLLTAAASVLLSVIIYGNGIDRMSYEYMEAEVFRGLLSREEWEIWNAYLRGDDPSQVFACSNVLFAIYDADGQAVAASEKPISTTEEAKKAQYSITRQEWYGANGPAPKYRLVLQVDTDFPYNDLYKSARTLLQYLFAVQNILPYIAVGCALLYLGIMSLLVCSAGHRRRTEGITQSFFDRIPLDLLIGIYVLLFSLHILLAELLWSAPYRVCIAVSIAVALADAVLITVLITSLAVRVKCGILLKNTVIWRCLAFVWRILSFLWRRGILPVFRFIGQGITSIPLVPKTALLIGINFLLDVAMLFLIFPFHGAIPYLIFLLIKGGVIALFLLASSAMLRKIQQGGEKMAEGYLDTAIDTRYMYGDFLGFANTMNQLGRGMGRAVEERMKSERFRTELITNVSHDIKTPLTSIVNYVDLIKKEEITKEPLAEYVRVLDRQSARLKKLTEDLIEASKAATGNVSVDLQPCDAAVLIGQIEGEYGERLAERNLSLIVTKPDFPVPMTADGRHIWRVFDNLMSNILKYAMPGSRVYLDLHTAEDSVCFTFRNMSAAPLNVPEEELLERFTRGDTSRSTEGSGLGLSIANSLTELQGGKLTLHVDGDLFKVTLTFKG